MAETTEVCRSDGADSTGRHTLDTLKAEEAMMRAMA